MENSALEEIVFVPQEERGRSVASLPMSVRLAHVLQWNRISVLGDLQGRSFSQILHWRNCGSKTLAELQNLIKALQTGQAIWTRNETKHETTDELSIPDAAREVRLAELPMSARLEGVLEKKKFVRLGDLHGLSLRRLRATKNCGKKTICELAALVGRAAAGDFAASEENVAKLKPSEFILAIDRTLMELPSRNREIVLLRLGGQDGIPLTLEEIAAKFDLTRERVRQVVEKAIPQLRRSGGPRLVLWLRKITKTCQDMVCPLTPELLSQWLGNAQQDFRFMMRFYVRLLSELNPALPAWPRGQEGTCARDSREESIATATENILRHRMQALPLKKVLEFLRSEAAIPKLNVGEFLDALKHNRSVRVAFGTPDQPEVRLIRFRAADMARAVLENSDDPLTPEEILDRAKAVLGPEFAEFEVRGVAVSLTPEKGLFLLGPRAYGLRKHFRLPESLWEQARRDFQQLLKKEGRQISSSEVVNSHKFEWADRVNTYELAQILREDKRFIDLGKFLFALVEWGIEEREYVKDLIPKVLAQVGRPLTSAQVLEQLQRLRSVSPTAISGHMRKHPLVRDYGFGLYGLKSWGDAVKSSVVANPLLIERAIKRAEPPLTFGRLCEILEISSHGPIAGKLWETSRSLDSVFRAPEKQTAETLLIHKTCRLERALVATATRVNRPMALYELQWEMNAGFGAFFAQTTSAELRRCLEHSPFFLRDANDQFILDIHLDQLDLDLDDIRRSCFEILSSAREIVGCEDLLERLEAEGKSCEELSPDILASVLREDDAFEEVGRNRFRSKTCKR